MKYKTPLLSTVYNTPILMELLSSRKALKDFSSEPVAHAFVKECLKALSLAYGAVRILGEDKAQRAMVFQSYYAPLSALRPITVHDGVAFILLGKSSFDKHPPNGLELYKQCAQFIRPEDSRSDHIDYMQPERRDPPKIEGPKLFESEQAKQKGLDHLKSLKSLLGKMNLTKY